MDAIQKIEAEEPLDDVEAIVLEQRAAFEAWAFCKAVDEEERALFAHRREDGQYASNTVRAGFAAWLSATLTEREHSAAFIQSQAAEIARLREALERVCSRDPRTSSQIDADWDFARASLTQPTE